MSRFHNNFLLPFSKTSENITLNYTRKTKTKNDNLNNSTKVSYLSHIFSRYIFLLQNCYMGTFKLYCLSKINRRMQYGSHQYSFCYYFVSVLPKCPGTGVSTIQPFQYYRTLVTTFHPSNLRSEILILFAANCNKFSTTGTVVEALLEDVPKIRFEGVGVVGHLCEDFLPTSI